MMISILQDADIVTGGLSDRDAFTGSIRLYDGNLLLCNRRQKTGREMVHHKCYKTEIGLNIFLARRTFLLKHPWDNDLKLKEHAVYFWSIKNVAKVVACPHMQFKHNNEDKGHEAYKAYQISRNRAFGDEIQRTLLKKYDIRKINLFADPKECM